MPPRDMVWRHVRETARPARHRCRPALNRDRQVCPRQAFIRSQHSTVCVSNYTAVSRVMSGLQNVPTWQATSAYMSLPARIQRPSDSQDFLNSAAQLPLSCSDRHTLSCDSTLACGGILQVRYHPQRSSQDRTSQKCLTPSHELVPGSPRVSVKK